MKRVGVRNQISAISGTTQNIVRRVALPPISDPALNVFSNKVFFALMIIVASSYETSPWLVLSFFASKN